MLLMMMLTATTAWAVDVTVTSGTTSWDSPNTYNVASDVTISNPVTVTGAVTLNLGSGVTLTVESGITVNNGGMLTVTGQGTLNVYGEEGLYYRFNDGTPTDGETGVCGNLTVKGGTVTVTGGSGGDGDNVGASGGKGIDGSLTVDDGTVTVTGGMGGSGYNSGGGGDGIASNLTVNGGTVTVNGGDAGAICDGNHQQAGYGVGGNISINGGIVQINGGLDPYNDSYRRAVEGSISFTYNMMAEAKDDVNEAYYSMTGNSSWAPFLLFHFKEGPTFTYISDGSSGNPYRITSFNDLKDLAVYVNGTGTYSNGQTENTPHDCIDVYFKQTVDITMGATWDSPIGNNSHPFKGHYNGDNKTISNLTVTTNGQYAGLFGYITGQYGGTEANSKIAEVYGLVLQNPTITVTATSSTQYAGAVVAYAGSCGRVYDNTVSGGTVSYTGASNYNTNNSYAGGVVGNYANSNLRQLSGNKVVGTTVSGGGICGGLAGCISNLSGMDGNVVVANVSSAKYKSSGQSGTAYGYRQGAVVGQYDINNGLLSSVNYYYSANGLTAYGNNSSLSPVADNDWVALIYTLTLGSGITTTTVPVIRYNNVGYYSGTITLGNLPTTAGYIYAYTVNGTSISGTSFSINADATVALSRTPDPAHFAVNNAGTEYTIKSAAGWGVFCDALEDNDTYNRFSGKTVKLSPSGNSNSITVSRMAGSDSHDFCGIFDGGGNTITINSSNGAYALFRNVSNGTIKNLHVTGTINASAQYAAGIISRMSGTVNIENCTSSVTIQSSVSGEGIHGGFVAAANSGTLNIKGCLFDGKLLTTNGTNSCGGFVGYRGGTVNITNCLYAPAATTGSEKWVGNSGSATFSRNGANVSNSYYTQDFNDGQHYTGQGKQRHTVTAGNNVTISGIALTGNATTYNVSGIKAYSGGLSLNNGAILYYGSGDQVSLTLANTTSAGYNFDGYTASAGTLSGSANPYTLTMPNEDVTIAATITPNPADFSQSGNEYTIHSTAGWGVFCDLLAADGGKEYFSGKTVKLVPSGNSNSITVTRMAGGDNHDFCGTFNGGGNTITIDSSNGAYALFRNVENGTIKNLHVTGTINASAKYAAGFISGMWGTVTIENCTSSVTIKSSVSGDGTHGGFVAAANSGTLNITGCVFDGKLITTNGTNSCGGFVGYNGATVNITNSLYAPATPTSSETWAGTSGSATFARNGGTISNCYYTKDFNDGTNYTAQGKQRRCITAGANVTVEHAGVATVYGVSGITAYKATDASGASDPFIAGIVYNNVLYAGADDEVSLTLANNVTDAPAGYLDSYDFSPSAGTLSGSTLTMPDKDVVVSVRWAPDPSHFAKNADGTEYTIHTAKGWNVFCDALQDNNTYNRFSGKKVTLANDIPTDEETAAGTGAVTRMAGSSQHDFCGTFDGGGHTLTVSLSSDNSHDYTAPFSYVSNTKANPGDAANSTAAIRNLNVAGTITASKDFAGGIVGAFWGTLTIENCTSSVSISTDHQYAAGVIGRSAGTATIEGCAFTGSLLGSTTTQCAGFMGKNDGTLTISNSLFAPDEVTVSPTNSATFALGTAPTIVNCYYTTTPSGGWGAPQGKQRRSITAGTNVTIESIALTGDETGYNVSGITAYSGGGLALDNGNGATLYYGSDDQVSLTLVNTATDTPGPGYEYAFSASAGTLTSNSPSGEQEGLLTMPDADVTVSLVRVPIDWAKESTGEDADHAYIIYNKDQLDLLAQRVNSATGDDYAATGYKGRYFVLANDITYSTEGIGDTESNYTAIGGYFGGQNRNFMGHFDGQGHTVSGIRIYKGGNDSADSYQGLFGRSGGNIRGITLADARITGDDEIGGIVGINSGTVSDCHVAATVSILAVSHQAWQHGGIVGNNPNGTVSHCTSAAMLTNSTGNSGYGGIAGKNINGTLRHNLAIGAVVPAVTGNTRGAICGENSGTFQNNYYYACTVDGKANATGVGCDNADVTDNDGAVPGIVLYDHSSRTDLNSYILTTVGNVGVSRVALAGRTLYKDGEWNTLCLPFNVTIADSPLAGDGVDVRTLSTSDFTDGTLTLNFTPAPGETGAVTTMEAGKPYIIKWNKPANYVAYDPANPEAPCSDIVSPVFQGVTVSNASTTQTFDNGRVQFIGTYGPTDIYSAAKDNLYLGAGNKLYYPWGEGMTEYFVNAFRAYFHVNDAAGIRQFVLNFGDEETGIISLSKDSGDQGNNPEFLNSLDYYTLDGVKLQGKPTKKGVYIHGGKKVVVP